MWQDLMQRLTGNDGLMQALLQRRMPADAMGPGAAAPMPGGDTPVAMPRPREGFMKPPMTGPDFQKLAPGGFRKPLSMMPNMGRIQPPQGLMNGALSGMFGKKPQMPMNGTAQPPMPMGGGGMGRNLVDRQRY